MSAPRRYPAELRERATKMVLEALKDPESGKGAIGRIGAQLGVNAETEPVKFSV